MNSLALALRQVRYENIAFWRNPVSAFFVFFFPLIFLVLFNLIFGSREMELPGGIVNTSTFYVPAIVAMSVIYTCYSNVAIGMSFSREQGLLKRTRGTPLPAWSFLFGRIVHSLLLAVILIVIVTAAGVLVYGVDIPTNTLPAALISLGVGAAAFCTLGLATTAVIPNAESSPAIVNVSVLPLLFISDVFIPLHDAPFVAHEGRRPLPCETLRPGDAQLVRPVRDGYRPRSGTPASNGRMDGRRAGGCPAVLLVGAPQLASRTLQPRTPPSPSKSYNLSRRRHGRQDGLTVHRQADRTLPDDFGNFGQYGGRFVPETLMGAIEELTREYESVRHDESFQAELRRLLHHYVGRPTPLYYAERLTDELGGAAIYLKREDLAHTGAHKINNALAQGLLAKRVGKRRIIAETGAGQHGVATATACALLELDCVVYMGEKDIARQSLNVFRMRLLGAPRSGRSAREAGRSRTP